MWHLIPFFQLYRYPNKIFACGEWFIWYVVELKYARILILWTKLSLQIASGVNECVRVFVDNLGKLADKGKDVELRGYFMRLSRNKFDVHCSVLWIPIIWEEVVPF